MVQLSLERSTSKKAKRGRPKNTVPLVMVNFRADPQTLIAIERLAAVVANGIGMVNGGKSLAIRRVLIEAAARLGTVSDEQK